MHGQELVAVLSAELDELVGDYVNGRTRREAGAETPADADVQREVVAPAFERPGTPGCGRHHADAGDEQVHLAALALEGSQLLADGDGRPEPRDDRRHFSLGRGDKEEAHAAVSEPFP